MVVDIILLLVGLALILVGANYLTDGAVEIAKYFQISEFVVGLTVIAIGTSMPEMVVSFISALNGDGDIAVGAIVGSNIFNLYGILGICALVLPMAITKDNVKKDIPIALLSTLLMVVVTMSGSISRIEGALLLSLYFAMMFYTIRSANRGRDKSVAVESINVPLTTLFVVGGFAALIGGGNVFLDSAVSIANRLHIPQNVIAVTIVACGTSLPEFAASFVSLLKGKGDIALGNVLGSNVANILLVLGACASVTPLAMQGITMTDMLVALAGMVILFVAPFVFKRMELGRIGGGVLFVSFVSYIYYIVSSL